MTWDLSAFAGDERMKSLFIYGAWTDQRESPCECCATPIAVLETSNGRDFPTVERKWVEIVNLEDYSHDLVTPVYWGAIPDLAFIHHSPERCRSLRTNDTEVKQ